MNNIVETCWNVPFTPSPIDFGRRRQIPVVIKRMQYTLPEKRKLKNAAQLFIVNPKKESFQLLIQK